MPGTTTIHLFTLWARLAVLVLQWWIKWSNIQTKQINNHSTIQKQIKENILNISHRTDKWSQMDSPIDPPVNPSVDQSIIVTQKSMNPDPHIQPHSAIFSHIQPHFGFHLRTCKPVSHRITCCLWTIPGLGNAASGLTWIDQCHVWLPEGTRTFPFAPWNGLNMLE